MLSRGRRLALWALAGLAASGGFLALAALPLPAGRENTLCLLRRSTGIPCPSCGLTRSFDHLADGHLVAAIAAHPAAPVLAIEAVLAWILGGLAAAGRLRAPRSGLVELAVAANAAALVALWVGRAATGTLPW